MCFTNGAFPLRGTTRFGTAHYGTAWLSSGRFALSLQFSTASGGDYSRVVRVAAVR